MSIKKGKLSVSIVYDDNTKVKILINSSDLSHSVETLLDLLSNKYLSSKAHYSISEIDNSSKKEKQHETEKRPFYENLEIKKTGISNSPSSPQEESVFQDSALPLENENERTRVNDILVLFRSLPPGWFSSKEIQKLFNERFGESLKLSEISIYLSRLTSRGLLQRVKAGRYFKYKLREIVTVK